VIGSTTEIGSGLNGQNLKILSDKSVETIVGEHRDRLARFGSDDIESALRACGRKLLIVDQSEMWDDLVHDMIDVLSLVCARLYGRRSARKKALKAVEATK
jgi:putative resolvase